MMKNTIDTVAAVIVGDVLFVLLPFMLLLLDALLTVLCVDYRVEWT